MSSACLHYPPSSPPLSYVEAAVSSHASLFPPPRCLATPCHTQDSICYHVTPSDGSSDHPGGVFTGDTLFIAGCGRFFEGTAPEMHAALSYLGTLPDKTITYNGHEYTNGNYAFAKSVEPDSTGIARLGKLIETSGGVTTGKSTIGDEKEWNPFMRLDNPAIRYALSRVLREASILTVFWSAAKRPARPTTLVSWPRSAR